MSNSVSGAARAEVARSNYLTGLRCEMSNYVRRCRLP